MDMVERVARAMISAGQERERQRLVGVPYVSDFYATPWEEAPIEAREEWLANARAAIEAMRDPTPKMLAAAGKALSPDRRPTDKWISVKAKHGLRYRSMIDAALSPSVETR